MNILSIDFDFFQDATVEQLLKYPDGVDYNTAISIAVWGQYYTKRSIENYLDIKSVKINHKLLKQIKEIVIKQKQSIPVLITNSHKYIYDFVTKQWDKKENLNIYNIDMHHDMFNKNTEIDCGNWAGHIIKDGGYVHWIGREVSVEAYGLGKIKDFPIHYDFNEIKNMQFDMIFLCRSDPWIPPHLDKYFLELANILCSYFKVVNGDPGVMKSRQKEVNKYADAISKAERRYCLMS